MKTFHVMRGVSGMGKSTAVDKIVEDCINDPGCRAVAIHSTDQVILDHTGSMAGYRKFFADMEKNNDRTPLSEAHNLCFKLAKEDIEAGFTDVILDNTNIMRWNFKRYADLAKEHGYEVKIHNIYDPAVTVEELAERNRHGVPLHVIKRQMESFLKEPTMK